MISIRVDVTRLGFRLRTVLRWLSHCLKILRHAMLSMHSHIPPVIKNRVARISATKRTIERDYQTTNKCG
jgi:hypothetical protein